MLSWLSMMTMEKKVSELIFSSHDEMMMMVMKNKKKKQQSRIRGLLNLRKIISHADEPQPALTQIT